MPWTLIAILISAVAVSAGACARVMQDLDSISDFGLNTVGPRWAQYFLWLICGWATIGTLVALGRALL